MAAARAHTNHGNEQGSMSMGKLPRFQPGDRVTYAPRGDEGTVIGRCSPGEVDGCERVAVEWDRTGLMAFRVEILLRVPPPDTVRLTLSYDGHEVSEEMPLNDMRLWAGVRMVALGDACRALVAKIDGKEDA